MPSEITTYQKKIINPLQPISEDIDILDIVHALHLLCRANGHFPHFYSVAQHSINCMREAMLRGYSKRVQLGCLLHDASEAYLSDVTRPVKAMLPEYLEAENRLQQIIYDKWITPSLTKDELNLIYDVDDTILYYEFLTLMNERISDEVYQLKSRPIFEFQDFAYVKKAFLNGFNALTSEEDDNIYVGIDWMKGKWIACELKNSSVYHRTFKSIDELCRAYENVAQVLIDAPIGLPQSKEEALLRPDKAARNYLKVTNRKSSIFNVPFRQLVYAKSTAEVWKLNAELGAKLTSPGVGILPCIRQVDEFLQKNPVWKNRLVESHPECAFQALNNGEGLEYSKHTNEGIEQRTEILSKHVTNIRELLSVVKKDEREDVLDSLCLAVTAKVGYKSIPDNPAYDSTGLPMRIVVADV